jgi:hypothetical protein
MTSSYHCGEYPSIVKEIEEEAFKHFQDFNIIRIKIEALASDEGVPETDAEKKLFWNNTTNYFEFHYKVLLENDPEGNHLKKLQGVCAKSDPHALHLSRNAFKQIGEKSFHYLITMRLFDVGRDNAFEINDEIVEFLTENNFPPLKVVREYVVYDTYIELDNGWE